MCQSENKRIKVRLPFTPTCHKPSEKGDKVNEIEDLGNRNVTFGIWCKFSHYYNHIILPMISFPFSPILFFILSVSLPNFFLRIGFQNTNQVGGGGAWCGFFCMCNAWGFFCVMPCRNFPHCLLGLGWPVIIRSGCTITHTTYCEISRENLFF